jgi:hypothetical protein
MGVCSHSSSVLDMRPGSPELARHSRPNSADADEDTSVAQALLDEKQDAAMVELEVKFLRMLASHVRAIFQLREPSLSRSLCMCGFVPTLPNVFAYDVFFFFVWLCLYHITGASRSSIPPLPPF